MIKDIRKENGPGEQDTWKGAKGVELHAHTKMSSMDGLNEPSNIVNQAAAWGQPAVAITDHGVNLGLRTAKAAKAERAREKI